MVHQCREGRTCSCGGRLGFRYLLVLGLSLLLFRGVTLVSMGLRSHAGAPASTQQQLRAHSEPQQPQLLQQRAEAAEPAAAQQQSAHPMDATTGGHASMHAPTDATADHTRRYISLMSALLREKAHVAPRTDSVPLELVLEVCMRVLRVGGHRNRTLLAGGWTAAFHLHDLNAAGCVAQRQTDNYEDWSALSRRDKLRDMAAYCSLVRNGKASAWQRKRCCDGGDCGSGLLCVGPDDVVAADKARYDQRVHVMPRDGPRLCAVLADGEREERLRALGFGVRGAAGGDQPVQAQHAAMGVATPSTCKVLVSNLDGWAQYVTREYYHWMHGLVVDHGWKSVEPMWLLDRSKDAFAAQARKVCSGALPGFVLIAEIFEAADLKAGPTLAWLRRQGVRLGFWQNDANNFQLRDFGTAGRQHFFDSFDALYGPYTYLARVFYPTLRYPERVWQPNGVALEMQGVPWNAAPLARVFVPGAAGRLHYPFRTWARERADGGDHRFVFLAHPGYGGGVPKAAGAPAQAGGGTAVDVGALVAALKPDDIEVRATVTGRDYARLMSKFLVCLTDLMRHTNLVAKHFEIPASGCLLLTSNQHPALLRAVGFVHMQNCVLYDKRDPLPMVKWALDPRNRAKVDEMRAAGRALVLSRHLIQNRSSLVDAHVRGVLSQQPTRTWWSVPDMRRDTACPCPLAGERVCGCVARWQAVVHATHLLGDGLAGETKGMLRTLCSAGASAAKANAMPAAKANEQNLGSRIWDLVFGKLI